jgi:hypothetical protein
MTDAVFADIPRSGEGFGECLGNTDEPSPCVAVVFRRRGRRVIITVILAVVIAAAAYFVWTMQIERALVRDGESIAAALDMLTAEGYGGGKAYNVNDANTVKYINALQGTDFADGCLSDFAVDESGTVTAFVYTNPHGVRVAYDAAAEGDTVRIAGRG